MKVCLDARHLIQRTVVHIILPLKQKRTAQASSCMCRKTKVKILLLLSSVMYKAAYLGPIRPHEFGQFKLKCRDLCERAGP